MKILIISFLSLFLFSFSTDEQEIKLVISRMFEGMAKGDSAMVGSVFFKDASLSTIYKSKDGVRYEHEKIGEFLKAVGTPHKEVWNEKLISLDIKFDRFMASAWTPYKFYVDTTFSHCGVNNFTLIKTEHGWRITSITDTRYKDDCKN